MPTRTYTGPHDVVDVPSLAVEVRRGESIEVSDDVAASLDEQPANWAKPAAKKAAGSKAKPPVAAAAPSTTEPATSEARQTDAEEADQ